MYGCDYQEREEARFKKVMQNLDDEYRRYVLGGPPVIKLPELAPDESKKPVSDFRAAREDIMRKDSAAVSRGAVFAMIGGLAGLLMGFAVACFVYFVDA